MRKLLIELRSLTCLKSILTLSSLLFSFLLASGQQQPPSILWSKSFGGTKADKANAIIKAYDGGFIIVGSSKSNDGDVTGHHGSTDSSDAWVVKLSPDGAMEWQKSFGGTGEDIFRNVIHTSDGNYLCIGSTKTNNNGDVSGFHGGTDIWVVKIDRYGNLLWQRSLGGSFQEEPGNILQAADGNYYVIGSTDSDNGDVSGIHEYITSWNRRDIWLVKLTNAGSIITQKCLGSIDHDEGWDIIESNNKSLIIAATLGSDDGDFGVGGGNPPRGYVIKMDSNYSMIWKLNPGQRNTGVQLCRTNDNYVHVNFDAIGCYPSNGNWRAYQIRFFDNPASTNRPLHQTLSNFEFCMGSTIFRNGYHTEGPSAYAIVNENINIWVGGSDDDLTAGNTGLHGGMDGFICGVNNSGNVAWKKFIGGSGYDQLETVVSLNDYEFVAAGYSKSSNGDVSGNHGDYDFWIVKMGKVNSIKGTVYADYNLNGAKDANEPFINKIVVESKKGTSSSASTTFGNIFRNQVDTGAYVTKVLTTIPYYQSVPASINTQFSTYYNTDSISFALQPIPGQKDYRVRLNFATAARPGFNLTVTLICENPGTDTLTNKKVKLVKDPRLQYLSAIPAELNITADTIEWNIASLSPRESVIITVEMIVAAPPTVNIGDRLESFAYIDSTADLRPSNNKSRLTLLVVGAFDPNDKNETKSGELYKGEYDQGEFLNYTIRFQNTGNDTAFNVVIRDTLESRLDITSFEMVEASHPYEFTLKDGKYATWTFSNIKLPDSIINETLSHGYVSYKIMPVAGLSVGDSVKNSASIYFDFNLPVKTNTQFTIIKPNPIAPPTDPILGGLTAVYCNTFGVQTGKINNLPANGSGTSVEVKLDGTALSVGADSTFGFNVSTLAPGSHAITVKFSNVSGSKTTTHNFFVSEAVIPEVNVSANITTIVNLATPVVVIASNAVGGGLSPKYTFAKDRNFNTILQSEGNSNTYNLDPSTLTVGENWIYVRMKTSETCYILQTNTDSIKLIRDQSTGIIDPDNPNRIINVYPNPFDQEILINGLSTGKTYSINLYNSYGQLMYKQRVVGRSSTNLNRIVLPGGIYLLSIFDEGKKILLGAVKISKK